MNILNVTTSTLQFLREKIITGELKPGQKLNETSLSTELGVSRPPIREAFRLLENDNLAISVSRKGTYVTELSLENFKEVFQIRVMIECYAVDLLKTYNIRSLPKVGMVLDRELSLPLSSNRLDPDQELDRIKDFSDFHISLVESSSNSMLYNIYKSTSYNLARYQYIYFHMEGGTAQISLDYHKGILDLIKNGNYDEAKIALKTHIDQVMELVGNSIFSLPISSSQLRSDLSNSLRKEGLKARD